MERNDFIIRYAALGDRIRRWAGGCGQWPELDTAVELSARDNVFFTPWMQRQALEALADGMLREDVLRKWLGQYPEPVPGPQGRSAEWSRPATSRLWRSTTY